MAKGRNEADLVRRADAAYRRFPGFASWESVALDSVLWDDGRASLEAERLQASSVALDEALRVALREAALTTGAIEDLYVADRGFTFSVAAQVGSWESDLAAQGPHVRRLFEAQLAALEMVVDAATRRVPITEAWLRQLHAELCREQATYWVSTPLGRQEQELPKGAYKTHPNHVQLRDGSVHSYCPVDLTAPEMHRLVEELSSAAFAAGHPVLQAAYAHHALVTVHPFADGNGRVARALASVFTLRASSIPLVVYTEQKADYLDALAEADAGRFEAFASFVLNVVVDTLELLAARLRSARTSTVREAAERVERLYASAKSAEDRERDAAASRVAALLRDEVRRQLRRMPPRVDVQVDLREEHLSPDDAATWRNAPDRPTTVSLSLRSAPPAVAKVGVRLHVQVSRDPDASVILRIQSNASDEALPVRSHHVRPILASVFREKLSHWVGQELATLLGKLEGRADSALRSARR